VKRYAVSLLHRHLFQGRLRYSGDTFWVTHGMILITASVNPPLNFAHIFFCLYNRVPSQKSLSFDPPTPLCKRVATIFSLRKFICMG